MPQLRPGARAAGPVALAEVLADPATTLLAARDGGDIVGLAVVAVYRRLSGVSAHLHDVVVDGAARCRGCGGGVLEAAIEAGGGPGALHPRLRPAPWEGGAHRAC